jgi:hypothetical protein
MFAPAEITRPGSKHEIAALLAKSDNLMRKVLLSILFVLLLIGSPLHHIYF